MATITTDTYLDGGTARTANETWTINNNARLTIRTDSRVHANAPASMTGTIGAITCSTTAGGKVYVDGTAVRWMPFDTGSGNVPAIGMTVTQGGVSGYLLGVWASYTSAPTAVGAAMPASGYLKFREVTGGPFTTGALTGIGANATAPDRTGWIEIACHVAIWNIGQLGELKTRGEWFEHETVTSGSAHQIIQFPTNGGGGSSNIFAVQIETAPGSGVYKWWHGLQSPASTGDHMYTTAIVGTDARNRYFKSYNDGSIGLGGDGTNLIGYVPPAGCKVRIPNIIFRGTATATPATNLFVADGTTGTNRPQINTNVKTVDMEKTSFMFYTNNWSGVGTYTMTDCALYACIGLLDNVRNSATLLRTSHNTLIGVGGSSPCLKISNSSAPVSLTDLFVTDCRSIGGGGLGGGGFRSSNITINNVEYNMITTWPTEQLVALFDGVTDSTITNLSVSGNELELRNCINVTVTNMDYCAKVKGPLTASQGTHAYGIVIRACSNIMLDGVTVGKGGTYANLHPYADVVFVDTTNGPVTVRNIGTRTAPLSAGSNATLYSNSLISISAGTNDLKVQRAYVTNSRSANYIIVSTPSSTNRNIYDSVLCTNFAKTYAVSGKNTKVRGMSGTVDTVADGLTGVHFCDVFLSDTTGAVSWYGMLPSSTTSGENYLYSPTGTAAYLAPAATVLLSTLNDYFYAEMTAMVKGHTALLNSAPVITGTSTNLCTYEYQIDTGSGWNGTWKTLNAATLSAETISPTGFKLKFKGTLTSAGTAQIQSIKVLTGSTLAAQTDNLYTLDTAQLSFTGLATGSEVRVYAGTDPATATEVGGTEATGGSTFSLSHSVAGQDGYIVILAMGYQPVRFNYTFKSTDDSILIQPVVDRNYNNPV